MGELDWHEIVERDKRGHLERPAAPPPTQVTRPQRLERATRGAYPAEYRRQVALYVLDARVALPKVARELDIGPETVRHWVKQERIARGALKAAPPRQPAATTEPDGARVELRRNGSVRARVREGADGRVTTQHFRGDGSLKEETVTLPDGGVETSAFTTSGLLKARQQRTAGGIAIRETFRADGTPSQKVARHPDGAVETTRFHPNGTRRLYRLDRPDGSGETCNFRLSGRRCASSVTTRRPDGVLETTSYGWNAKRPQCRWEEEPGGWSTTTNFHSDGSISYQSRHKTGHRGEHIVERRLGHEQQWVRRESEPARVISYGEPADAAAPKDAPVVRLPDYDAPYVPPYDALVAMREAKRGERLDDQTERARHRAARELEAAPHELPGWSPDWDDA